MFVGFHLSRRFATTLSPRAITHLLSANEVSLDKSTTITTTTTNGTKLHQDRLHDLLPSYIRLIECNQLAANNPIEDRLRISSFRLPGSKEPTLILGVFDGHGGGTTANLISRRLFNYIAISLHPKPGNLEISTHDYGQQQQQQALDSIVDLHNTPQPSINSHMQSLEIDMLNYYRNELRVQRQHEPSSGQIDIAANLRASFRRCDDDLSREIQENLMNPSSLDQQALRHYLSASVSGCCAIVMVIHEGIAYLASSGDCRAVLGVYKGGREVATGAAATGAAAAASSTVPGQDSSHKSQAFEQPKASSLNAFELNDEHNCDNINEIRRLSAAHPRSEQNTMIKHNRLLGHLMPFRAFGDFTYKWPADTIHACGITRAFGPSVIPANYESPPYLIVEPDVRVLRLDDANDLRMLGGGGGGGGGGGDSDNETTGANSPNDDRDSSHHHTTKNLSKYLVMASDGLWELFESSRDVIETIVDHSLNSGPNGENEEDYDTNCATYLLRSALRSGPHQDIGMDRERMRRLNHIRLESTLTLPKSVVRNYRDDISLILMKLA